MWHFLSALLLFGLFQRQSQSLNLFGIRLNAFGRLNVPAVPLRHIQRVIPPQLGGHPQYAVQHYVAHCTPTQPAAISARSTTRYHA